MSLRPARVLLAPVITAGVVIPGPRAHADVTGRVVDATGDPVAGARVAREGAGAPVVTDAAGAFVLPLGDGPATIVASAAGRFHAVAQVVAPAAGVELVVEAVPVDDQLGHALRPPSFCGGCHPDQLEQWEGSPMARAGENRWVYDLYDGTGTPGGAGGFVYTRDSALAATHPASECASCHQPEPWIAAPFTAMVPIAAAGDQHGVSCEVCHRIAHVDEARVSFPGIYPGVVRLARGAGDEPVQFGVLGDVGYASASMRPAYQPQLTAAVCAACHQDTNDHDLDGDFEDDGSVISEPTYLEWLASSYADPASPDHATCVDCHMPAVSAPSACSVATPEVPRGAGRLRSHRIEGTTAAYLEAALSVRLAARVDGDDLVVDVEVDNDRTGHHVPTGVTTRNIILLVTARHDGEALAATGDQVVDELGGVGDPADGYYAGLPGKLYAKVPVDAAGAGPVFFTEAAALGRDERIPAHAVDRTSYRFARPVDGGDVEVEAKVIYRRAFRALVDAKGWVTDGHGRPLPELAAPDHGHVMARAAATLDVEPLPVEDAGCGCRTGGGGGGAATALAVVALAWVRRRWRASCILSRRCPPHLS